MCSIAKDVKASVGGSMPGSTLPGSSSILGGMASPGAARAGGDQTPGTGSTLLTGGGPSIGGGAGGGGAGSGASKPTRPGSLQR